MSILLGAGSGSRSDTLICGYLDKATVLLEADLCVRTATMPSRDHEGRYMFAVRC